MSKLAWALPFLILTSGGCNKKSEPAAEPQGSSQPGATSAPAAATPAPDKTQPAAPAQGQPSAGGLTWQAPSPLKARRPKSAMRAAEYVLENDESAELTVFYFGPGQGGEVEANITRWLGQFAQPDGSDSAQHAKRSERAVSGLSVALVEVTGTYSGGMAMPGAAAPAAQNDAMLLGAIATGPQGPVFFKLIGKRASVENARAAFDELVGSLKPSI